MQATTNLVAARYFYAFLSAAHPNICSIPESQCFLRCSAPGYIIAVAKILKTVQSTGHNQPCSSKIFLRFFGCSALIFVAFNMIRCFFRCSAPGYKKTVAKIFKPVQSTGHNQPCSSNIFLRFLGAAHPNICSIPESQVSFKVQRTGIYNSLSENFKNGSKYRPQPTL